MSEHGGEEASGHAYKGHHQMISLIIPTYNRPQFLARLLRYYRELNFPYTIVVADSSSAPACEANQNTVASLRDVLSIHYELYRPDISAALKIAQALATVDTEYAVLCADKDFLVPRAIEQCAHYLDANPDYSVARGLAAIIKSVETPSGRRIFSRSYSQRTIDWDEAGIRLQDQLQNYTPTFYSVHRRLELMRNMQLTVDNTVDLRFGELLPSCLSVIQGKVRGLDVLCMVRQSHPDYSTSRKTIGWLALLTSDDFSQRLAQFRNCLAEELAVVTGMPMAEANDTVNHAFAPFLARLKAPAPGPSPFEQPMQRVWRVIQILPAAARSALLDHQLVAMIRSPREAYRQLQRERARAAGQDDMSIDNLLSPHSPFHVDFLPIYEQVRRYPDGVMPSLQEGEQTSDAAY